MNGLELGVGVLIESCDVVFFERLLFGEGRHLGQFLDPAGKHSINIIPAKFVVLLLPGDSNKVFSHLEANC